MERVKNHWSRFDKRFWFVHEDMKQSNKGLLSIFKAMFPGNVPYDFNLCPHIFLQVIANIGILWVVSKSICFGCRCSNSMGWGLGNLGSKGKFYVLPKKLALQLVFKLAYGPFKVFTSNFRLYTGLSKIKNLELSAWFRKMQEISFNLQYIFSWIGEGCRQFHLQIANILRWIVLLDTA